MIFGFVDNGSDADIIKSLGYNEDLIKGKGLDKTKLVQKDVQYRMKNGGVGTRKAWVKASEDQPTDKQPKQQEDDDGKQKTTKPDDKAEVKWGEGCTNYLNNHQTDAEIKASRPDFPWPEQIKATPEQRAFADKAVKEYDAKKEYGTPSEYVKKYKGVNSEAYCSLKKASMPADAPQSVKTIYDRAVDAEPQITKVMQQVAHETGMKMFGYDYRIKEGDSFLRKIRKTAKDQNKPEAQVAEENTDTVRYTAISQPDQLVTDYNKTIRALQDAGNTVDHVINHFTNTKLAMNCVEVVFKNPSGQKFELWFHTPETKHVQDNGGHKYYEALRVMDDPADQKKCEQVNFELFYKCQIPQGIESIKTTKNKEV